MTELFSTITKERMETIKSYASIPFLTKEKDKKLVDWLNEIRQVLKTDDERDFFDLQVIFNFMKEEEKE